MAERIACAEAPTGPDDYCLYGCMLCTGHLKWLLSHEHDHYEELAKFLLARGFREPKDLVNGTLAHILRDDDHPIGLRILLDKVMKKATQHHVPRPPHDSFCRMCRSENVSTCRNEQCTLCQECGVGVRCNRCLMVSMENQHKEGRCDWCAGRIAPNEGLRYGAVFQFHDEQCAMRGPWNLERME